MRSEQHLAEEPPGAETRKSRWSLWRIVKLLVKIYAMGCTVLLTAYFGIAVTGHCFGVLPRGAVEELNLNAAYGRYMTKEHPRRETLFFNLVMRLDLYARVVPIREADALTYLGKPALVSESPGEKTFVFLQSSKDTKGTWAFEVTLEGTRVTTFSYCQAAERDYSLFKPYASSRKLD